MWHVPAPQRIWFFSWLVVHGRIMHNLNRFKRGMAIDPFCHECTEVVENSIHILRDCNMARVIRCKFVPSEKQDHFFTLPLNDWLKYNLEDPGTWQSNWATLFVTTTWWLWKWCTRHSFYGNDNRPPQPWSFIYEHYQEIVKALKPEQSTLRRPNVERLRKWEPPPLDWVVLNVGGAS